MRVRPKHKKLLKADRQTVSRVQILFYMQNTFLDFNTRPIQIVDICASASHGFVSVSVRSVYTSLFL